MGEDRIFLYGLTLNFFHIHSLKKKHHMITKREEQRRRGMNELPMMLPFLIQTN